MFIKYTVKRTNGWLPNGRGVGSWVKKGCPCNDESVLYLDCININILLVIWYHSFARCFHWQKPGDRRSRCMISYNSR